MTRSEWRKTPKGRAYRLRAAMKHHNRNAIWVNALKVLEGCADCGFNKWPEALDFDHKPSADKEFNISQRLMYSATKLKAEIAKCVVRCANCHRHITQERLVSMVVTTIISVLVIPQISLR